MRATIERAQTLTGATDTTEAIKLSGQVAVQVTGSATAITGWVERSTIDPNSGSNNWAPAHDTIITGNPSTGISAASFYEPGMAWWRWRSVTKTGASVYVSIQGQVPA